MSETEDLKKAAMESKQRQTVKEVGEYLDRLTDEISRCHKKNRNSLILYTIVWLAWVAAGIWKPELDRTLEMIFIFALIYNSYRFAQLRRAHGEFQGAIEILRILGLIPPHNNGDRQVKNKEVESPFRDMVKSWFTEKKEAQEKVFVPA